MPRVWASEKIVGCPSSEQFGRTESKSREKLRDTFLNRTMATRYLSTNVSSYTGPRYRGRLTARNGFADPSYSS